MNQPLSSLEEDAAAAQGAPAVRSSAGAVPAPALDLDVLMARLREEVEARKRKAASEPAASGAASEPRRVSAEDLIELPEAAFVLTAYRLLLGREAAPEEADRQIDRLLLGRLQRTKLLAELLATDEARAAGARLEGLPQARRRERLMSSPVARLFLGAANVFRTIYLLPKRIRQFIKRVEGLEQRASEEARQVEARIETLEQEVASLRGAIRGDAAISQTEPQPAHPSAARSARRRSDAR
jgi:hypothetical protein